MSGGAPHRIVRLVDLEASGIDAAPLLTGIARIFRDTAARWPDSKKAASIFQDLWLDQYIRHERDLVWLALAGSAAGDVAGYLVGCRVDPARSPRFQALSYFATFAALTAAYPAHLHINVDGKYRNEGIGARLVEAFSEQLRAEGVGGVHVVTGRDQRNVAFYKRLAFKELAATPRGNTEVLFLARAIAH